MRKLVIVAAVIGLFAGTVSAKPSLRDVARVEQGLFTIAVADKIRRECGDISGRMVRAHGLMRDLVNHARDLGYSDSEIRAYVDDKTEKTRVRARRDAYLSEQGVVKSRPETYCVAGRAEIRNSSEIGELLRAR